METEEDEIATKTDRKEESEPSQPKSRRRVKKTLLIVFLVLAVLSIIGLGLYFLLAPEPHYYKKPQTGDVTLVTNSRTLVNQSQNSTRILEEIEQPENLQFTIVVLNTTDTNVWLLITPPISIEEATDDNQATEDDKANEDTEADEDSDVEEVEEGIPILSILEKSYSSSQV